MNPLFALLVGVFILGILFFLFKPQGGVVSRLMKMKKDRSRELIEDALKHLYDCEYKGVDCSLNSISGSLYISGERSTHIISMLEAMNLISSVSRPGMKVFVAQRAARMGRSIGPRTKILVTTAP